MHAVVSELYRTFARYPPPIQWSVCDHCVTPHDLERLRAQPLNSLQVADLDRYAFKALSTWGSVDELKHFLPRLFELAFEDFLSFAAPEVLLGKLAAARWHTWPEDEQHAMEAFLDEFWRRQLSTPGNFPHDDRLHTTLGGLSQVVDSLEPYLAVWSASGHELTALHLAQFIDQIADEIMTTGTTRLWGDRAEASMQIVRWLNTGDVTELLDAHQHAITQRFPFAIDQLAGVRAAR